MSCAPEQRVRLGRRRTQRRRSAHDRDRATPSRPDSPERTPARAPVTKAPGSEPRPEARTASAQTSPTRLGSPAQPAGGNQILVLSLGGSRQQDSHVSSIPRSRKERYRPSQAPPADQSGSSDQLTFRLAAADGAAASSCSCILAIAPNAANGSHHLRRAAPLRRRARSTALAASGVDPSTVSPSACQAAGSVPGWLEQATFGLAASGDAVLAAAAVSRCRHSHADGLRPA